MTGGTGGPTTRIGSGLIGTTRRYSEILLYVVTAALTLALTVIALELWSADFGVPLTYSGDALAVAAHFKTVLETGWYEFQPLLGAPFGQTYNDFPTADNLNFMAAGVFGLVTGNYVIAMNAYFVVGFVACALTALWLMRRLGISGTVAIVLSTLFALAPYHFYRGESHLFLGSYYIVPLSIAVVIMVIRGEALWTLPARGARWYRWVFNRATGTFLILVLSATARPTYAVFFLVLLAFAGVVRLIRSGNWARFWGAATAGALTAVAMVINMLPDLVYSMVNGQNPAGLDRLRETPRPTPSNSPSCSSRGSATGSTRLPSSGGSTTPRIRSGQKNRPSAPSPLAGLVALFLMLAYVAATGGTRRRMPGSASRWTLLLQLGSLVFVAFLFSTTGGLATIISFATSSLRGWNRMSIFIALLCLVAVGLLLDAAITWLHRKAHGRGLSRRVIAGAVAVVVLAVGFVDQTPANLAPSYASAATRFDADAAWFGAVDDLMPAGAEVLQLPYQPYPETTGPTGVLASEAMIPFLHTTDIAWSGGGIKGRPRADWPGMLERYSPGEILALAAASGFTGIHIDRISMTVADREALEAGIADALGTLPLVSADLEFAFFDIGPR